jgi:CBS domain containing-hemolysin-like protein
MRSEMKKTLLWFVWIFLVTVYIATIAALCAEGRYSALFFGAVNLACAVFLFFAEGFEIAFAMLWPTRESAEKDIRDSLQGLDPEFVLAQRQVIVVFTITIVGLTTSALEWIAIPGVGKVQSHGAPYVFSLLFTTFTILWFCQVFPKRIAARSSARFWRLSCWLLKPIIVAGKFFDLPSPSDDLVNWWERLFGRAQSASPQNSTAPHVTSLWAGCDCAVCNPNAHSFGSNKETSLSECDCSICQPVA